MDEKRILVTQPSLPAMDDYIKEIEGIWQDHWLTNFGSRHNQLCEKLKEFLDIPQVSLFSNGHLALEAMLEAFDLEGEVITTPFTFASTTHAIVRKGLTPVFCDIDKYTYCIDHRKIEELITPKTCAILPVHVYGMICDVEAIQKIAQKYNLKVIYDGAHAFGVKKDGIGIGRFGDATMFSFHATKVFHTIEGGAIAYSDENLRMKFHQLQNFGFGDSDDAELVGGNAKMNEFQAAMGLCNLRRIDMAMEARKQVMERYMERLSGVDGLVLPPEQPGVQRNYAYLPVRFEKNQFGEDRDQVKKRLESHNIFSRKYFYPLTSAFECYKGRLNGGNTPIAQAISETVLALPIYEGLTQADVDRVCDVILEGHK